MAAYSNHKQLLKSIKQGHDYVIALHKEATTAVEAAEKRRQEWLNQNAGNLACPIALASFNLCNDTLYSCLDKIDITNAIYWEVDKKYFKLYHQGILSSLSHCRLCESINARSQEYLIKRLTDEKR